MKITTKQFTSFGNIGIVQLRAEPLSSFPFASGGSEIRSGNLLITELGVGGTVSKLSAVNNSDTHLLLTDADVLIGAKQNRIVNKSVLLAPGSETIIDVLCIERLRWQYNSSNFISPDSTADHALRKIKAESMKFRNKNAHMETHYLQSNVWSYINDQVAKEGCNTLTENYHELADQNYRRKVEKFPKCNAEIGCNAIAIVSDGKVQSIDIFGNEAVYRYYFPLLRDSSFRIAEKHNGIKEADKHESFYRTMEMFDLFETAKRFYALGYAGAGELFLAENELLIGFELSMEKQLIHTVIFSKTEKEN